MTVPFTLAALGATALTEGIKFLYGQATELLKRHRERKQGTEDAPEVLDPKTPPQSEVLEGKITAQAIDQAALDRDAKLLLELRRTLADYVDGIMPATASDTRLLEVADALRGLLEVIYGQHITFTGERRPPSGTPLDRDAVAKEAEARASAVTVIVKGERAVGIGRDNVGGVIITGDQADS